MRHPFERFEIYKGKTLWRNWSDQERECKWDISYENWSRWNQTIYWIIKPSNRGIGIGQGKDWRGPRRKQGKESLWKQSKKGLLTLMKYLDLSRKSFVPSKWYAGWSRWPIETWRPNSWNQGSIPKGKWCLR